MYFQTVAWTVILHLAFQSIGIVYGDIGTSPLYVFASTFPNGIKHNDDILGVLSIIFYTLTLIPLVKYVFIVLRANDNGDGKIFDHYYLFSFSYVNIEIQVAQDQVNIFLCLTRIVDMRDASFVRLIPILFYFLTANIYLFILQYSIYIIVNFFFNILFFVCVLKYLVF